jgi:hypothetical protein
LTDPIAKNTIPLAAVIAAAAFDEIDTTHRGLHVVCAATQKITTSWITWSKLTLTRDRNNFQQPRDTSNERVE